MIGKLRADARPLLYLFAAVMVGAACACAGCGGGKAPNADAAARALRNAHFNGVVVIGRTDGAG